MLVGGDFVRGAEKLADRLAFFLGRCVGALNALLGQTMDLNGLKDGVCVTRLVDRGVIQVKAWEVAK